MRLIMMGPPAAGKGTQAELLSRRLAIPHLSSGALLRDVAASGSARGVLIGEIMARGDLVPDDIVKGVVAERATAPDAANGFILDGYPRTLEQAQSLDRAFAERGFGLDAVVRIAVDDDVLVERVENRARESEEAGVEARADDTPEVLRARILAYRKLTAPLIEFYTERGLLRSVDGTRSIDEIAADIFDALGSPEPVGAGTDETRQPTV